MTEDSREVSATSAVGAATPNGGAAGADTLRRNSLRLPEVLAQSVANMSPTGAMALLPLLVFLSAGNGTWISFLIAVVLMVCVGYCAAQFSRRQNSAGSFYVWVRQGPGPGAGLTAGWGRPARGRRGRRRPPPGLRHRRLRERRLPGDGGPEPLPDDRPGDPDQRLRDRPLLHHRLLLPDLRVRGHQAGLRQERGADA